MRSFIACIVHPRCIKRTVSVLAGAFLVVNALPSVSRQDHSHEFVKFFKKDYSNRFNYGKYRN